MITPELERRAREVRDALQEGLDATDPASGVVGLRREDLEAIAELLYDLLDR